MRIVRTNPKKNKTDKRGSLKGLAKSKCPIVSSHLINWNKLQPYAYTKGFSLFLMPCKNCLSQGVFRIMLFNPSSVIPY